MYRSKLDPEKDPAGATPETLTLVLLQPPGTMPFTAPRGYFILHDYGRSKGKSSY